MSSPYPRPRRQEPQLAKTHYASESLVLLAAVIVLGIFTTTLPQPQGLGKLPLQHILKGKLHVDPHQMSFFFLACGLFWYIKPLAGILTDSFPLFGTRRRYYLLFSSLLAGASWIAMGFVPQTYWWLLLAAIVVNLFMVMMSTVTGAFLVEVGQSQGATGRLTSVRQVTYNICGIIQGPLAGFLASGAFMVAAGANAAFVAAMFPIAYFMLREKRDAVVNPNAFQNARLQLSIMGRTGYFWLALVFIGLFYFAPGFSTLQYYRQNDVMKIDQQHIGYLGSIGSIGGVIAAALYGGIVRRFSLRPLLTFGIVTAAVGTLCYLDYNTWTLAMPIDFQNGFFFGFAEVALIDLAARATPAGCEGLGYSLILSVRNLSLFGADYVGSVLADGYKWSWSTMVWLNAISTAVVLILIPFMPRLLMGSKDGTTPNTENTGEPEPVPA